MDNSPCPDLYDRQTVRAILAQITDPYKITRKMLSCNLAFVLCLHFRQSSLLCKTVTSHCKNPSAALNALKNRGQPFFFLALSKFCLWLPCANKYMYDGQALIWEFRKSNICPSLAVRRIRKQIKT